MKKKRNNVPFILTATRWLYPKLEKFAPFIAQRIFRFVFYVPIRYKVPEKEKELSRKAELTTIVVEGKSVQCYSWGDKALPYVLLVHGWAGRATQFRKFVQPLEAAGYRIIGFDGPAHGKSEGRHTSILQFEKTLHEIFKKFGEPVALITHSFGGAASLYSASHGLPIRKLINIASPTIADEILSTYLRAINGTWPSVTRFRKFVIEKTGKSFEEFTSMHAIKNLPHPIDLMLVHDEEDQDVYIINAEELIKAYPSAKLFKTRGLGHTRILKDDDVIRECVGFIKL
ncbi:MAG: alpha/beta hydrolase [Cyclobacteriaceae bacterium]|nr:alpha/beta hydrolase [Cyclobacteriaceae bacterium]